MRAARANASKASVSESVSGSSAASEGGARRREGDHAAYSADVRRAGCATAIGDGLRPAEAGDPVACVNSNRKQSKRGEITERKSTTKTPKIAAVPSRDGVGVPKSGSLYFRWYEV